MGGSCAAVAALFASPGGAQSRWYFRKRKG